MKRINKIMAIMILAAVATVSTPQAFARGGVVMGDRTSGGVVMGDRTIGGVVMGDRLIGGVVMGDFAGVVMGD
jgi:hypothetical protein